MKTNILVVYGTRGGSTREVAEFISKVMAKRGAAAEAKNVSEVGKDISSYSALVVGTGIRAGRPYVEIKSFLEKRKDELKRTPVAYFAVSMTLRDNSQDHRKAVDTCLNTLRAAISPVDVGLFAGKMDYSKLGMFARFIVKNMVRVAEGDYRDWAAIDSWVQQLLPKLSKSSQSTSGKAGR